MQENQNSPKIIITLLWISILFFMIFADIFSIIIELENGNTLQIPMDAKKAMAIASILTAIPILMIVLSWMLPRKTNRKTNIIVAIFTGLYIITGGTTMLHYIIISGLEIILIACIIKISIKWKSE